MAKVPLSLAGHEMLRPPEGGLCDRGTDYILSPVFFIFVDLDLAIFFLLILSFDISPFDMLSLWAAGPVVAGLFVSVDWAITAGESRTKAAAVIIVLRMGYLLI